MRCLTKPCAAPSPTWLPEKLCQPPQGSDAALRYLRDRINVPRDMSIYAAKHLRTSLEATAALDGNRQGPDIPLRHRRDPGPHEFCRLRQGEGPGA